MNNAQIINFIKVFIVLDLFLVLYSFLFQNATWVLNTQVAFFASLLITLSSYFSYRRNVNKRLSNLKEKNDFRTLEDRDKIDEIDDPYDLYSEYEEIPEEELNTEKIKEIIKEEKTKVKRNSIKNTFTSASGFISIFRVVAYGFLVLGFFALNNNKIFIAIPFLIGLSVVPLGTLLSKIVYRRK
ncbi:hypothetical protein CP965_04025 [Halarcobacter mediterraneus]|uniref:Uncharacterized protein n=1 Tax=Halarcobacter mediterraneus TaxID=2023153 RepID=A0A4Q1B009_9BACT|nr:hypothetical protein [Halarcobacter mediterraneus]RXK14620.1 hypothetical protein CP965_04025 [Halarcobacter mediterraneus]